MGEYAEMMLDGTMCMSCGEYLGSDNGFPTPCPNCADDFSEYYEPIPKQPKKHKCRTCNKRFRSTAARDQHERDVGHPFKARESSQ